MSSKTVDHYGRIRSILIFVLVLNWAVALAKIIYGFISRSASITADGFHSLSDGISNLAGLIGIAYASQPKDLDHPYGHKKYETLFSLGIGGLLFFVCFELIQEAFHRLFHPVIPTVNMISFGIMFATLAVNLIVMRFENNQGKKLKSDILVSDSIHTRADIFTTISVIFTLIAIKQGYIFLDSLVTILIALLIAYSGFEIIRQNAKVLTDTVAIDNIKQIKNVVLKVEGVQDCHKIRSRGRLDDIYIDLHAQVSPQMHMAGAHKISHEIEDALKKAIPGVTEVIVHMEPNDRTAPLDAK